MTALLAHTLSHSLIRRLRIPGLLLLLLPIPTSTLLAQEFDTPLNISKSDQFSGDTSDLFIDAAGNLAVVWEEGPSDGSDLNFRDVFLYYSGATRVVLRPPVNVSERREFVPRPAVAIDLDGRVHVAWQSTEFGGIRIALSTSDDGAQSFSRKGVTGDFSFHPSMSIGPGGEIYLVYMRDEDSAEVDFSTDKQIFLIRSDNGGESFTAPVLVSGPPERVFGPRVGTDAVGNVHVAWYSDSGFLFARSTDGGASFGAATSVPGSSDGRALEMLVEADGTTTLVWSGNNERIELSRSTNGGVSFVTETIHDVDRRVSSPDLALDPGGDILVGFTEGRFVDSKAEFKVRIGRWAGPGTFDVTSELATDSRALALARLAIDPTGRLQVAYQDFAEDAVIERDVFLARPPNTNVSFLFVPLLDWENDEAYLASVDNQLANLTGNLPLEACPARVGSQILLPSVASHTGFACTLVPLDCGAKGILDFVRGQGLDPAAFDEVVGVVKDTPCAPIGGCNSGVIWLSDPDDGSCSNALAHEVGHSYALSDEYQSNPAGCEDSRCNDGGPLFGGTDINWLGADENCDPRADQGCCSVCSKDYPDTCCKGNEDVAGGRSLMSSCGASKTWEQRSIDHLTGLPEFGCENVGSDAQLLTLEVSIPESGRPILRRQSVGLGRPTRTQDLTPAGDTRVVVRYLDGGIVFDDSFQANFAYNGPVVDGIDYRGLRADAIEELIRVPVSFPSAAPRPTTLEITRSGDVVFRGTTFGRTPEADAGEDRTVECNAVESALVVLDGTRSSDADGDLLEHIWSGAFGSAIGSMPVVTLPLGESTIDLEVGDGIFTSATDSVHFTVQDTVAPRIDCGAPDSIDPSSAPIVFTTSASDVCDDDLVVTVTDVDCFTETKKGWRIDKTESCVVEQLGPVITVVDSGGIGDRIVWTARTSDETGNETEEKCAVDVVPRVP